MPPTASLSLTGMLVASRDSGGDRDRPRCPDAHAGLEERSSWRVGPIFAFTMRRSWRSRSRGTRTLRECEHGAGRAHRTAGIMRGWALAVAALACAGCGGRAIGRPHDAGVDADAVRQDAGDELVENECAQAGGACLSEVGNLCSDVGEQSCDNGQIGVPGGPVICCFSVACPGQPNITTFDCSEATRDEFHCEGAGVVFPPSGPGYDASLDVGCVAVEPFCIPAGPRNLTCTCVAPGTSGLLSGGWNCP
jgi:hypothetical protein